MVIPRQSTIEVVPVLTKLPLLPTLKAHAPRYRGSTLASFFFHVYSQPGRQHLLKIVVATVANSATSLQPTEISYFGLRMLSSKRKHRMQRDLKQESTQRGTPAGTEGQKGGIFGSSDSGEECILR
jgi:hypothetical protein